MTPASVTDSQSFSRARLLLDGLINYGGFFVTALIGFVMIPLMVRYLPAADYGLWLIAIAIAAVMALIDLGTAWNLTREFASRPLASPDLQQYSRAAGMLYLAGAIVGVGVFAGLGWLGLPFIKWAGPADIGRGVFLRVGLTFAGDHLLIYSLGVLHGVRRFGLANLAVIASTSLRAIGTLVLLRAGHGILEVTTWHAGSAIAVAAVVMVLLRRMGYPVGVISSSAGWRSLRATFTFGLLSQGMTMAIKLVWDAVPLVIGFKLGPAGIVPYYLAQKFPLAIADVAWHFSEALFPAASGTSSERVNHIVIFGTRAVLIMTLPLSIVVWVTAPHLLTAWLGGASPTVVTTCRILTVAVAFEALGVAAMHVLWAAGEVRTVAATYALAGVAIAIGSISMMGSFGPAGAALGFLAPLPFVSLRFLAMAAALSGTRLQVVLRHVSRGMVIPALLCIGATVLVSAGTLTGWVNVVLSALSGGIIFLAAFYTFGADAEERALLRRPFPSRSSGNV